MIKNKTWKNLEEEHAAKVKSKLVELGGEEKNVKGNYEVWKVKISDSEFTFYSSKKGNTLYCNGSRLGDPIIQEIYDFVDNLKGGNFITSNKKYLIGLDETGKGELVGHIILSGIFMPTSITNEIENNLGSANTKNKRDFNYWDQIFVDIDKFRNKGLDFVIEKIPPWVSDKYNINKIIDVTYQRILNEFLRKIDNFSEVRIVLDDYGIGNTLKRFLKFLENKGAEIIVVHKADDNYLEAKVASLVAKREREAVIEVINKNKDFEINGIKVGSGNAGNEQTQTWLQAWHQSRKPWPWFIKKSFKTIREIEGKPPVKKLIPPLNESILSKDFLDNFSKGVLSIQSLSLVCPHCGNSNKSVNFVIFERDNKKISTIKCGSCDKLIENVGFTLKYYCGYVLPDTNALSRHIISNDLEAQRFFQILKSFYHQ